MTTSIYAEYFKALAPYIDVYQCGEWHKGSPKPLIPAHIRDKRASDRTPNESRHFHAGTLSASKIGKAIEESKKLYYKANRRSGFALLYIDIDDHEGQTDRADLTNAIARALDGQAFTHDGRLYLKVFYDDGGFDLYHRLATRFVEALEAWRVHKNYESTVDSIKSVNTFGRLPIANFTPADLERFEDTPHTTLCQLEKWAEQLKDATPKGTTAKQRARHTGSFARGLPFTDDQLGSIPQLMRNAQPHAQQLHTRMLANPAMYKPEHRNFTVTDICQYYVLLRLLAYHPNKNGSCPHERQKAVWVELVRLNYFESHFHATKITALRNLLSDSGLIIWATEGNHYQYSLMEGEKVRAMCWELTTEAKNSLDSEESSKGGTPFPISTLFIITIVRPIRLRPLSAPQPGYRGANRAIAPPEYASVA